MKKYKFDPEPLLEVQGATHLIYSMRKLSLG